MECPVLSRRKGHGFYVEKRVSETDRKAVKKRQSAPSADVAKGGEGTVPAPDDDTITLKEFIDIIRKNRRIIGWCVGIFFFLGLSYALFKTPEYRATIVVRPVTERGSETQLGGRISALATLAGVDLSGGGSKDEYIAVLESRQLAKKFMNENDIKKILFRYMWDEKNKRWKDRVTISMRAREFISRFIAYVSGDSGYSPNHSPVPTDEEAYVIFDKKIRHVSEDRKTGIVKVYFQYKDPKLAAYWANKYISLANEEIRSRSINEASRAIEFLRQEAEKATDLQLKSAIYGLIQGQLQRIATARARPEYAFRVIDPAVVPERPYIPNRKLAIIVGTILGISIGIFLSFVRHILNNDL